LRDPSSAPSEGRWKHKYPNLKKEKEKEMKLASRYSIVAVFFIFLVLLANCPSALAVDYTKVGVKVGNTANYKTSTSFGTYNGTQILVYGVILSGIVYLNFTYYYPNGTVASRYQIICDLIAGSIPGSAFLLAANLTAGNPIYSSAAMTINETITMTFAGTPRTVNHLRLPNGQFEAYWDKATGLVCKLNYFYIVGWLNMTIMSTDAWTVVTPPPPPPAPVTPPLSIKLSGEFDYSPLEPTNIRLAALVKNATTMKPVSGANVIIQIYYPNGTLWVSGIMLEKLAGTGIYEWQSSNKIYTIRPQGVYLVQVKAFVTKDPTASDMLLFHIDPPAENQDPLTTISFYAAFTIVLAAGTIVGAFVIRRHKKTQTQTAGTIKLPPK